MVGYWARWVWWVLNGYINRYNESVGRWAKNNAITTHLNGCAVADCWGRQMDHPGLHGLLLRRCCGCWRFRGPGFRPRCLCVPLRSCRSARARPSASHECCARDPPWRLLSFSPRKPSNCLRKMAFPVCGGVCCLYVCKLGRRRRRPLYCDFHAETNIALCARREFSNLCLNSL